MKPIIIFCVVVALLMLFLTGMAWSESRLIARLSMLSASMAFFGAAAVFHGFEQNMEVPKRFGWAMFIGFIAAFVVTLVLMQHFRF